MQPFKKQIIILLLFLTGTIKLYATTWDEPWAEKIIRESDYFILADIISHDEEKGIKIKILKQLGGEKLPLEIEITNFYLLKLMSTSGGHGPEFHFDGIGKSYFFLKKNEQGEYCISTPTSGFDIVDNNNVHATYRHSYHQALVPYEIYELTMTAIFNNYHGLAYDTSQVTTFIEKNLKLKPAGFGDDEIKTFFLQHVSMETIYHLKLKADYRLILPFFNDSSNFHNRVSASRALVVTNNDEVINLLLNKIEKNTEDDFTTVICIWTLKELNPRQIKADLERMIRNASTEANGFGGNIMDSRVSTHFPTVKKALEDLLQSL
jgi:hypothetical protein